MYSLLDLIGDDKFEAKQNLSYGIIIALFIIDLIFVHTGNAIGTYTIMGIVIGIEGYLAWLYRSYDKKVKAIHVSIIVIATTVILAYSIIAI